MMMKMIFALVFLMAGLSSAQAEMTKPVKVAWRTAAHCQAPKWSPDASRIAYDVYNPKADSRETWIVRLGPGGGPSGEREVKTGGSRASSLMGGRKAPVLEFAWAPSMKAASNPYVFSSRSPRKNFDLFVDGTWLTRNPGHDGQPSWSSDSRYIAYASQRQDSGDIYVIDLGGNPEKPLQVTMFRNATEFRPKWAPGKNYLLFTRAQDGAKGQDIGLVADVNQPMDSMMMVTNWSGDEIRPSWSPDGLSIAFFSNKDQRNKKLYDLWVVSISGKNPVKLVSDVVVPDSLGPAWTPDGEALLYVKRDFKRDNPIRWVRFDGSVGGPIPTGTQLNTDLALTKRGARMALVFRSQGLKGSASKTWQQLFSIEFSRGDLQEDPPKVEKAAKPKKKRKSRKRKRSRRKRR